MRVENRLVGIILCGLVLVMAGTPKTQGREPSGKEVESGELTPFLRKYCYSCHDNATATAKLSLESLSRKREDYARWIPVYDKIRLHQMPPKDELQPSPEERHRVAETLRQRLHETSLAQQQSEGRVVLRRLNVTEYETTLRDLFGQHISIKNLLPPDNVAAGFDNVSEVLDVSSVHLLRYQDAAEQALKAAIPRQYPAKFKARIGGKEIVSRVKGAVLGGSMRLDGDTLLLYAMPYNHIPTGTATVPQRGRYVVRASMYALGTDGKPLPVRFTAGKPWGKGSTILAVRDVSATKGGVTELECELNYGDLVDVTPWTLQTERQYTDARKKRPEASSEENTGPALAVEWLEIEGPLDTFPPVGYTNLFGDLPMKPSYNKTSFSVAPNDPRADAERLMKSFLARVFRRPVSAELQEYFTQIVMASLDKKQPFEDALLLGYRAALCSPHFILLSEPRGTRKDQPAAIDDFAVASRLSYFLWSTLPDDELLQLAGKGELTNPTVLRAQVERMLLDPRSQRLTENFVGQWLELRKINDTTPDPQAYAEFDNFLFWSMPKETTLFFDDVLKNDRSLTDFTHSDWTYLNERLATHYGIPGVYGGELRFAKLPSESHRGGVLTHASIMKVTADGTKTSPILRGKWVLERIVGLPPAPPPPNVSAIEPDIRGATTIRQQLDKHRNIESCAACHKHIDPPGFALESFDAIGGWRDFYRAKRGTAVKLSNYPNRQVYRGLDVEKDGVTADGKAFQNIDEYKQILLADKDQLARNVTEKLVIYATGADIQFADREVIEQLVARSRAKNYAFRSLLHDVVQSRIFLHK